MTHLHYSRSTISVCILLTGLAACSNSGNDENVPLISEGDDPAEPLFSATLFDEDSSTIDNPLFPMTPGALLIYEGTSDEGETERVEIHVSHQTRSVDGVDSRIAIAREFLDGEMVEEAFDWFAQDTDGNVWYMGEASNDYENGAIASTQGSWESGADVENVGQVASAGIIMKATPVLGDQYRQEEYPGVAEDSAQVVDLDSPQTLANGQSYSTVKILEWNPLESDSSE
ncbi:MAG: hypothetical protein KDJ38_11755, partial [Gammaproteobacteria bacterium]|nr:hypothetical protein [Gammaproteobacteria bacterium]